MDESQEHKTTFMKDMKFLDKYADLFPSFILSAFMKKVKVMDGDVQLKLKVLAFLIEIIQEDEHTKCRNSLGGGYSLNRSITIENNNVYIDFHLLNKRQLIRCDALLSLIL